MLEAQARMAITIPSAIISIFVLLMLYFKRLDRPLIVMLSIPFALTGAMWSLYLASYNFSIAVGVGTIALAGVATETVVIMLVYLDLQTRQQKPRTVQHLFDAVLQGAILRVRPVLMTVTTLFAGLLPIFVTEGLGSDVMRRISLPMFGGMISTLILTLIVIPVVYYLWESRGLRLS